MESTNSVGLIAGEGVFPLAFARAAGARGYQVIACAIRGSARAEIESAAARTVWVKLGKVGEVIRVFRDAGVKDVVMCGRVRKESYLNIKNLGLDLAGMKLMAKLKDGKTSSILDTAATFLKSEGFTLRPSVWLLDDLLAPEGVLTKRKPTKQERADIEFGARMAAELAKLDIGQLVAVKDRTVVAAEAVEGSDQAILRAGKVGGPGCVIVKMNRPRRELRFDVPTIGAQTIRSMAEAGATALAVQANETLLLDLDEMTIEADRRKISVIGVSYAG